LRGVGTWGDEPRVLLDQESHRLGSENIAGERSRIMTKIYLAARYSRHVEMQGYAKQLRAAGYEITSRWINGSHQVMLNGEVLGPEREAMFESGHESMKSQRRE